MRKRRRRQPGQAAAGSGEVTHAVPNATARRHAEGVAHSDVAQRAVELARFAATYSARRGISLIAVILGSMATGLVATVLVYLLVPGAPGSTIYDAATLAFVPASVACTLLGIRGAGMRRARQVRRLAHGQGREIVGTLLGLLAHDIGHTRGRFTPVSHTAVELLTGLLPLLRASDAALLDDRERDALIGILRRCEREYVRPRSPLFPWDDRRLLDPAFVRAILLGLEHVGDARLIPCVQQLAELPARNAACRSIRDAARDCLPALRQSAERYQQSSTLLRPAAPADSQTLLRPAHNAPTGDSTLLLRLAAPELAAENEQQQSQSGDIA